MTTPQTATTLQVSKTYNAPRERVFRAWTEPDDLKQWWGSMEGMTAPIAEVDLRPGGKYKLGMLAPGAPEPFVSFGTFQEVTPPEKLVFTFRWENDQFDVGETLVTIEFLDRGGSTEVVLTHERFPNEAARNQHTEGWNGVLARLESFLAK